MSYSKSELCIYEVIPCTCVWHKLWKIAKYQEMRDINNACVNFLEQVPRNLTALRLILATCQARIISYFLRCANEISTDKKARVQAFRPTPCICS